MGRKPGFQIGWEGGPGRPKGSVSIVRYIKEALAASDHDMAQKLAQALIDQAAQGNGTAIKEILARIDGPTPTQIDVNATPRDDDERVARIVEILELGRARRDRPALEEPSE